MTGKFVLVVHPEANVLRLLGESLSGAGFKVMAAGSDAEAMERIGNFGLFMPDLLITSFANARPGHAGILAHLRSNPLTESIPVVVLTADAGEERRQALRAGFHHLVLPPYESEELALTVRLALDQHRDERLLSGSLQQFSVADLLQTAEAARRSGTVLLRSRGRGATLWLRGGRIVDAESESGQRGKEAVFEVALWNEGSFEADFSPVSVPERIEESTSFLLLEAMRRHDEAERDQETPPHAAMPDPPPAPPRELRAVHRALTLLAVTASYAAEHLAEALVEKRLERARLELVGQYPALARFCIVAGGRPTLAAGEDVEIDIAEVVQGVAAWLIRFFTEAEEALPGRFQLKRLRQVTEAVHEDMRDLGFYRALGLEEVPPAKVSPDKGSQENAS